MQKTRNVQAKHVKRWKSDTVLPSHNTLFYGLIANFKMMLILRNIQTVTNFCITRFPVKLFRMLWKKTKQGRQTLSINVIYNMELQRVVVFCISRFTVDVESMQWKKPKTGTWNVIEQQYACYRTSIGNQFLYYSFRSLCT